MSFYSFSHFKIALSYFWAVRVLDMLLIRWVVGKYFLWVVFHFLDGILWNRKVFNFDVLQFIFSFVAVFKKPLLFPMPRRFTPLFSFKNFLILALTFRFLIHFGVISMWTRKKYNWFLYISLYPVILPNSLDLVFWGDLLYKQSCDLQVMVQFFHW